MAVSKVTSTVKETPDAVFERLWEHQQVPSDKTRVSPDDQLALDHFQDTYFRLPSGQFQVALPRKSSIPKLGDSRANAI